MFLKDMVDLDGVSLVQACLGLSVISVCLRSFVDLLWRPASPTYFVPPLEILKKPSEKYKALQKF